jgi:hypothetical protein
MRRTSLALGERESVDLLKRPVAEVRPIRPEEPPSHLVWLLESLHLLPLAVVPADVAPPEVLEVPGVLRLESHRPERLTQ